MGKAAMKRDNLETAVVPGVLGQAERDLVAIGIVTAAIIMFVGTGSNVLPDVLSSLMGSKTAPDPVLVNALILNIAIVVFGWRRYAELMAELRARKISEQLASQLARTDALTGCLNRRSLEPVLHDMVDSETDIAYVLIDLDGFKKINDLHGHSAGDRLLLTISERLRSTIPANAMLARIGGDEFAVVMPMIDGDRSPINSLTEQILATLGTPILLEGAILPISASIGIASLSQIQASGMSDEALGISERLMHFADMAMYAAKRAGGKRAGWFDNGFAIAQQMRCEREKAIRRGLDRSEFVPYFERQVDLDSGKLVGFEMLARWHSASREMVSPDVFIPLAEEMGVIGELSEQLMRKALKEARHWPAHLTLAINISPLQLRDPWFSQKILKLLVETGFPANRLEVEITENCLMEDLPVARSVLESLRNLGTVITLDDFGTGYSSLSQLQSLPFDRIKIDRSFVGNIDKSLESRTIIESIRSLGDGLGLPITAEGIESQDVLDVLTEMGKFKGQGYLFGRPESAAKLREQFKAEVAEDKSQDLPDPGKKASPAPKRIRKRA